MSVEAKASDIRFEKFVSIVEEIRDRLLRAAAILRAADVPYAAIGGYSVAAWVTSVDPDAVRVTKDVDFLLRREDLDAAKTAFASTDFRYWEWSGIPMFLDGPDAGSRRAVHIIFAGEKVRPEYPLPAATMDETTDEPDKGLYRILALDALVRMKLTSYRLTDRVHLFDLLNVGLIDASWRERVPHVLADRLREVIDQWNAERYWPGE